VHPPAQGSSMTFSFRIEGREAANPSGREDPEELHAVTHDYFRTMGIPIVQGRAFDSRDRADAAPVVIINQALARKHWPNQNPLGKRINFGQPDSPWLEIVGVAGDTRMASPDQEPVPVLYKPHAQITWNWLSWFGIVARVRPATELNALRAQFEAALWGIDDQVPLQTFEWVSESYGQSMARRSFAMRLILVFAALATTLTIVGLYGLVSFTVAQEKREIGVRLALGARPANVTRQVIARSLKLSFIGLFAGLAITWSGARLLSTLLYDVSATDPVTLVAIAVLITASAAVASWLPARRATRQDAVAALRG
jgi:predicted permease